MCKGREVLNSSTKNACFKEEYFFVNRSNNQVGQKRWGVIFPQQDCQIKEEAVVDVIRQPSPIYNLKCTLISQKHYTGQYNVIL